MKVVLNHSENSGVSYYRLWQQAKYLKRAGVDVHNFPDHTPVMTPDEWEKVLHEADIFVTQKSDNPQLIALAMAARDLFGIPIVFEIDDDIYDVSKSSPAYQYYFPGSPFIEMTEMLMKNVDALTVSTEALKKTYSKLNKNIYVLPNAQDPEDWDVPIVKGHKQNELVIGWAGSATHYDDLKLIWRPMKKLLKRYPHVKFRVLGCLPDFLDGHPQVELRTDWAPIRKWQSKLGSMGFDIGVVPVVNRAFNIGKSKIKWQEYSMLGIPTVASRVGEYKQIHHEEDGLLADNNEYTWEYQIERLIKDAALRQTLGENAKQRVLRDFNIQSNIGQWESAYRDIVKQFKSVSR